MPNLSGTGGHSSHVNYATSALFDRMFRGLHDVKHAREAAAVLAVTYQANTGSSPASLKRIYKNVGYINFH